MSEAIRVLIVEDLPTDAELTEREIRKALGSCQFRRVETREDYLAALDGYGPALIVSDFKLPHFDGLTALTLAMDRCPDVPFIIVTGSMNEDTAVECMKAGAWDYVIKEHVKRLGAAVQSALERQRMRMRRKLTEQALGASETRYRRLFEAARDGILILDADTGLIVDVNPFLTELTGYSHDEFLQKHLWEIGPFKDAAASKAIFAELLAKTYVRYDDLPLQTRDGRTIAVEFVSNMYRVDSLNVIQCNIRDLTARKRAEDEREKLEEQLRMAQKLEAIGSLAGGIAHDFNNVLSVILGCTELAIGRVRENDGVRDELLEIRKAGERAAALTRQLLAFGRKQVLQPVLLNLNQVAVGVEKMLRRILGEDIDYAQVLAPDLGAVRADPGQIEQVLMNLVVNARDAMPKGGKLTIETSNVELDEEYAARHVAVKPGPYVHFAVTDTGCGMDAATQARIFEPFFTTKEKGKGTGLGLSTVYGIVKQSGGNIWVYSEPGQGTTFRVYLPREIAAATKVTSSRLKAISARPTGTETILVVEDEEAVCEIAKRILSMSGYTVLTAVTADAALRLCQAHEGTIHLLLTDVVMPQMGGKVLAERVALARPGIKVLYMSGYTDDAIVHHGTLDPGTHFISKPFSAADLTRKVREVLDSDIADPAAEQDM
jgi:PAS domain S-box-containing protein